MNFIVDARAICQAYWCPVCGHIKDARDVDRYGGDESRGEQRTRWCHNYRAHDGGKRKMRPIAVETPVPSSGGRQ